MNNKNKLKKVKIDNSKTTEHVYEMKTQPHLTGKPTCIAVKKEVG